MPTIAVTGATGQLGRLVIAALLERNVEPRSIIALVRDPSKAAKIAAKGVDVRTADYNDSAALVKALAGVDRLLLVSSSEVGQREAQHTNVIEAAEANGVGLIAYTSILNAGTTTMQLAAEHQATEARLKSSSVPFVMLRNGWYSEVYTDALASTLEHGAIVGSAGDGRAALAPRQDYAEAAAAVLTTEGHVGRVYELAGDDTPTMAEVAATIAEVTGRDVVYRDVPVADYTDVLRGAGLPDPIAGIIADSSAAVGRGELTAPGDDLTRLIDRASTPFAETVRQAAAVLPA